MFFLSKIDKSNFDNMLFADKLKEIRESKQMLQKHLAAALDIDTPMYSRIERGERQAKKEQVIKLAHVLDANEKELIQLWLADRVYEVIADEEEGDSALRIVSEEIAEYGIRH